MERMLFFFFFLFVCSFLDFLSVRRVGIGNCGIKGNRIFFFLNLIFFELRLRGLELEIKEDGIYFSFKFNNPLLKIENFSENSISILFSRPSLILNYRSKAIKFLENMNFFFPPLNLDSENWISYQRDFISQCSVQLCGLKTDKVIKISY